LEGHIGPKAVRPSSKCILVTGASGFVGSRLVSRLKHHGHTIVATCTGEAPAHSEGIHWLKWNALTHQLPEIEERVDTVIHLAGHRDYHQWPDKAAEIFDVAVGSTVAWLEFARIRGVKSFILASTGDALGNMDRTQREDDGDYRPASFYGAVKACSELISRQYEKFMSIAVARFYHPYGLGGDRFLVNRLLRRVSRSETVFLEGDEGIILNPVWIDDLCEGLSSLVMTEASGTFHLAGPRTLTLRALVELMGKITGIPPKIETRSTGGYSHHDAEFERMTSCCHYRPVIGPEEGLRLCWKEMRDTDFAS